ncbi:MAG: hypothetical protein C0623_00755 [Desulfuromonas sp.]|nr:MAG: hypothetical protein C0623_00755 [Desulfuromonas sp.]
MKQLVDVVNFNADASCLDSAVWLDALDGGSESRFFQWLDLYARMGKKVVLGFPGATIADIATFNPEAIALINRNPAVFEIIIRPFAHDIALLRLGQGFQLNYAAGKSIILKEFENVTDYYLPPEFMLTNEQVGFLIDNRSDGVFINPGRFADELQSRIPENPYQVNGLFDRSLNCIPFYSLLTGRYLHAIHKFDCSLWNEMILGCRSRLLFSWRDGESAFLVPNGLARERFWLQHEDEKVTRCHLAETRIDFLENYELSENQFKSYPVHSFTAWMKEFRMLGFIHRVRAIEEGLHRLSSELKGFWLMTINSDILSSVEKKSPEVSIRMSDNEQSRINYTIQRSERGYEGEEYLALLERSIEKIPPSDYMLNSKRFHMLKFRARMQYLSGFEM